MAYTVASDTVEARLIDSAGNPLGAMTIEVQRAGVAFEMRPVVDHGDERHELMLASLPAFAEPATYRYARLLSPGESTAPAVFIRP